MANQSAPQAVFTAWAKLTKTERAEFDAMVYGHAFSVAPAAAPKKKQPPKKNAAEAQSA